MIFLRPQAAVFVAAGSAAAISIVLWRMRRLSLRTQFVILLAMGVAVAFVLMTAVQVPEFPRWLAVLLLVMVFVAAPFATRTFMRSLKQEEQDELNRSAH